jgi:hypothetical protein
MTDDLYPAATLPAALRTLADSDQPPVMDVGRVLHRGRRSLVRRRMAALGGGTAVLAASALLVGTLAGTGSGVQGGADSAAAAAFTVDPHDPVTTHWQFAYVPPGMIAYGGYDPTDSQVSTILESTTGRFQLELLPLEAPFVIDGNPRGGGATEKVPVKVPGTTTAYWEGFKKERITSTNGEGGQMASLDLRLKSGQWIDLIANNIEARADWKAQVLKAAASVVHQDRSVPMPLQVAGAMPQGFTAVGGHVMRKAGVTTADFGFRLGPDQHSPTVGIFTYTAGSEKSPAQTAGFKYTCKDSDGLSICVSVSDAEPAQLKAVGGAQGLLDRVTSLGNDPANWTTDVAH